MTSVDFRENRIAQVALGDGAVPIDAVFFDKRSDANWAVPAHQDVELRDDWHASATMPAA